MSDSNGSGSAGMEKRTFRETAYGDNRTFRISTARAAIVRASAGETGGLFWRIPELPPTSTTSLTSSPPPMTDVDAPDPQPPSSSSSSVADLILNPPANQPKHPFAFDDFLRKEYRFGLDPNRKTCPLFVQGHCPMGNACPDKHAVSSSFNKFVPLLLPDSTSSDLPRSLVCKHWLRSLCKKGEACEFLHEYNLRKMPECNFYVRYGYCSNNEECLYLHIHPDSKIPVCPHYENGFCPMGPVCSKKHTRTQQLVCKFYLAGFCPVGKKDCKEGAHPKWTDPKTLPPPTMRKPREEPVRDEAWEEKERERDRNMDRDRFGGRGRGGYGGRRFFERGPGGRRDR
ncbi:hypothetical protein EX30DRAFT_347022 [Ascodesmis nigricans]|uniref:mRNA 3'-end-processing protein n=1 Tax=Ascodesmis nigricans TaxID=341454 RepID=A0A4S2N5C2_9PEZI|nr:hypothetical protein EX30DRAFT_347022 [Ascodesmis nigricans]